MSNVKEVNADVVAEALQRRARVSRTVKGFGEAIVRASLLETAQLVKDGKVIGGTVEIPARIFIRIVPDPNNIDVKFEECMSIGRQTALQSYVDSHAPALPEVRVR